MTQFKKPLSIEELKALDDKDIDFSDQPEIDESFWATARVSELCKELGVRPVTLYRYVDPNGNLRDYGKRVLGA